MTWTPPTHRPRKQLILAVLFCVILGLTLPQAGLAQGIIENILGIAAAPIYIVISIIIGVLGFISIGIFTGIIAPLTNWAISEVILNVDLTKGLFIETTWTFTRDLVNMFFILILVFIGLATILRIREYEAGKILPKLIIIALLINFSPVLVGLIVDAANILMNFFLTSARETLGSFPEAISNLKNFFVKLGEGIGNLKEMTAAIVYGVVVVVFYALASLIYLFIALIFFFRIIAIWTLVILAPLAFACFILPVTKRWWDMWWNQLVQWSIIGVIVAFFLYLGSLLLGLSSKIIKTEGLAIEEEAIVFIFPHFIALVFIGIGIMLGLQTGAMGARQIIGGTKGFGKWIATRRPIALGLGKLAGGTAAGMVGAEAGMQRLGALAGKVPWIGKGLGPIAKGALAAPRAVTWATRKLTAAPLAEYAARAREFKIPKEFDTMSSAEQARRVKLEENSGDRAKLIHRMIQLDTFQFEPEIQKMGAELQERLAKSPYYKKEVSAIQDALTDKITAKAKIDFEVGDKAKGEMEEKIDKMAEEISAKAEIDVEINEDILTEAASKKFNISRGEVTDTHRATITEEEKGAAVKDIAAGAVHVREMKPEKIRNIIKPSIKTLPARIGFAKGATPSHLRVLRDSFDEETVKTVFEGPGGLNTIVKSREDLEKLYKERPRLIDHFATTPAGREWHWEGLKFMPEGFAAFSREMDIKEALEEAPDEIKELDKDIESNRRLKESIREAEAPVKRAETERRRLEARVRRAKAERRRLEARVRGARGAERERLEARVRGVEAERERLETEVERARGRAEDERRRVEPQVSRAKAAQRKLQRKIRNERRGIKENPELQRVWAKIETLRRRPRRR